MPNHLVEAIACDDGDRAAKIIQAHSASNPMTLPITCFRRPGRRIANSAPASLASGCKPRRAFSPDDAPHAIFRIHSGPSRHRLFADRPRRTFVPR